MMRKLHALGLVLAVAVLAGCSATGGDPAANDPYEAMNRKVFDFDIKLDRDFLLPTAAVYVQVVPQPLRDSIHSFLLNLDEPVTFANDVLQGEGKRGAQTVGRFVVNSTLGFGGLADVATQMGIPYHSEDFGQTLAVWGVGEGPYLVLPFVGPDPPRDAIGQGVDTAFDPLTYISYKQKIWWSAGRVFVGVLDVRARNAGVLQSIERGSVDYYASVRSLYRQNRQNEINNGKTNIQNLPNF